MELTLIGHDYKYAVEQSMLMLYPEERPVYAAGSGERNSAVVGLRSGKEYRSIICRLHVDGVDSRGTARVKNSRITDEVTENRLMQHAVKRAFYAAAMAAGHEKPAWGSLTGVRPGKLLLSFVDQGMSLEGALRVLEKNYDVTPERCRLLRHTGAAALAARKSLGPKDVCLYVDIPFCPTRCAYCSFISVEAAGSKKLIPDYLEALNRELEALSEAVKAGGCRVVAIYIGGGTPTTLEAEQLEALCGRLRALFDLSACREFTVEAGRPDTITPEKLAALQRSGVSRVSVNPQTMSDTVLEAIGRKHSGQDIFKAMELVRQAGDFDVNMDLIAGLPGDTPDQFADSVRQLIALKPENITVHTLALKKGSRFTLEHPDLPGAAEVGAMLENASALLSASGYTPYYLYRQKFMSGSFENVGWTKPGKENLYNICIMEELTGILSAGAGGSTKLVEPGSVERIMAPKYPREYVQRIEEVCAVRARIAEFYRRKSNGAKSIGK